MKNVKGRTQNKKSKITRNPLLGVNRSLLLFILIYTIMAVTCASFKKKNSYIEPVNIVVLDNSRIENHKIRHIFRQYLIKELVEQGNEWLTIIHADSLTEAYGETTHIEYTVNFDIMDFYTHDIESDAKTLLAGVKIIDPAENTIVASFIDNTCGKNTDGMCDKIANSLAGQVTKKLIVIRTRQLTMPDVLTEPQDSLQTEHQ